jgi:hypothetical protein
MAATKSTTKSTTPAKRTVAQPATPVEKGSPLAKRAKRQGYDLPEVPADVVLDEQQPRLVTADKGSPLAKRAKRQGYELPESPETVITEGAVSVPFGGNRNG